MSLIHLTDKNFHKEVIEATHPVLVDFSAQWCGPCQRLSPIIEELAKEHKTKLKVCKLDVEEASKIASNYGVMSVPTILFFKEGKVIEQIVGFLSKAQLEAKIKGLL